LVLKIKDWLTKNERFKEAANVLPALKNLLSDWGINQKEAKELELEVKQKEQGLQKTERFIQEFNDRLATQQTTLKTAETAFLSQFSTNESRERGQLLELITTQIEQLDGKYKSLEILIELNEDYQELIGELNKYDEEIIDLENKRAIIEGRLLTAIEMEATLFVYGTSF